MQILITVYGYEIRTFNWNVAWFEVFAGHIMFACQAVKM
jgi:hypothetical protein